MWRWLGVGALGGEGGGVFFWGVQGGRLGCSGGMKTAARWQVAGPAAMHCDTVHSCVCVCVESIDVQKCLKVSKNSA